MASTRASDECRSALLNWLVDFAATIRLKMWTYFKMLFGTAVIGDETKKNRETVNYWGWSTTAFSPGCIPEWSPIGKERNSNEAKHARRRHKPARRRSRGSSCRQSMKRYLIPRALAISKALEKRNFNFFFFKSLTPTAPVTHFENSPQCDWKNSHCNVEQVRSECEPNKAEKKWVVK